MSSVFQSPIGFNDRFASYSRNLKAPQKFEIQAMTIGGLVVDLLVTTIHIRDQFFAIIVEDVTRWKEAQAKVMHHSEQLEQAVADRTAALEEALQVKNRFLAVVSHELRTPVAVCFDGNYYVY